MMDAINERHAAWRAAHEEGRLHVFELRVTCPCCRTPWHVEILDDPDVFEIPDLLQMGLAMLCGACEARRRTVFVVPGKGGWSAPFLTKGEISQVFGRLHNEKAKWIEAEGRGAWGGKHSKKLRDDRADVLRACTTMQRDGRRYNVTAMTAETLAASGLGWKIPPAPLGRSTADGW